MYTCSLITRQEQDCITQIICAWKAVFENMAGKRPEHLAPPDVFYNDEEAAKYTTNTRMMDIQRQMSSRALELLALPEDESCFLLDVGCGSGLSGELLTENGHFWIGVDISQSMLNIAHEREVEGDLILNDVGQGIMLRPGTFDGCISISALQWLCNADKKSHNPVKRLYKFFTSLFACLCRGSKAVFQFYPENPAQVELITAQALRAGFTGGVVVDFPNSAKAKKMFLCLFSGTIISKLPPGLGTQGGQNVDTASFTVQRDRTTFQKGNRKPLKKSRDWIQEKKERRKRQGKEARPESKFTGRKRRTKF